jgi:hypothetical protein
VGVGLVIATSLAGVASVGCAGGQGAKFASIKSGDMPEGEAWPGVYYNPVYGYLHMVAEGDNIVGRWKRTDSSHWGELSGSAEGNVVHFTWKEHQYGAIGPSGQSQGSGVFIYKMGDNHTAELDGKYSLDESNDVGDWHCVKQTGMQPKIESINGDNPADTAPAAHDKWN